MSAVSSPKATRLVTPGDPDERYPVPPDSSFAVDDKDFLEAVHLEEIGRGLIEAWELASADLDIIYLWKRKGGKLRRTPLLGKCLRPSGLTKYFGPSDFIIWLAADHCRAAMLTRYQVEALLYHELLHASRDEAGVPRVLPHDWEGFRAEVEDYGLWLPESRPLAHSFQRALNLHSPISPA